MPRRNRNKKIFPWRATGYTRVYQLRAQVLAQTTKSITEICERPIRNLCSIRCDVSALPRIARSANWRERKTRRMVGVSTWPTECVAHVKQKIQPSLLLLACCTNPVTKDYPEGFPPSIAADICLGGRNFLSVTFLSENERYMSGHPHLVLLERCRRCSGDSSGVLVDRNFAKQKGSALLSGMYTCDLFQPKLPLDLFQPKLPLLTCTWVTSWSSIEKHRIVSMWCDGIERLFVRNMVLL